MRTVRSVTVIQPTNIRTQGELHPSSRKKRVAAYARVSTNLEEQQTSYEAQVDYYTRHIQGNPDWIFVKVYTDEGISATSTKNREGFKRMINDALAGKIDLILTKSVSRFARNTVDTLTNIRQLKEKSVEVFFEKENIYTFDSKGEFMLTLLSSIAQEESRAISENVAWGQRKRFADGKVRLPYKRFLGYEKGDDDLPRIVEDQAKVVRLIYKMYLEGHTPVSIARYLTDQGIPSPSGKPTWQDSTVDNILRNEKYKGDAILQKTFTVDFLTKRIKINEGEIPQYYVENSHPAIIEPEVFDLVQNEIARRKKRGSNSCTSYFSSRIVCGECGGFYGSKVWHSTSKYRRTIWQCNRKFKNNDNCRTPHLYEDTIRIAFVEAMNSLISNKAEIIGDYESIINTLSDTRELDRENAKVESDLTNLAELLRRCVEENAGTAMDQAEYQRRYDELTSQFEAARIRKVQLDEQRQELRAKRKRLIAYMTLLRQTEGVLTIFDEGIWVSVVESVLILNDHEIVFRFKDGSELPWRI